MEGRSFEVEWFAAAADSFLAGAESTEILSGAGSDIGEKLEDDASSRVAADAHVEENLRVSHGCGESESIENSRVKNGNRVRVWGLVKKRVDIYSGV